jgi:lipoate-protein ligase A
VSSAPSALFDPEPLRQLKRPTLGRPLRAAPVVVLGGTQRFDDLDKVALERDWIGVRRRRGGGGAVLLHPEDLWVELWLPRSEGEPLDVRATARQVGTWWREVLEAVGVECEVHEGSVVRPEEGAHACFAAVGPGEVTVHGAKLVGISQWRVREGTLASSVLAARPPSALSTYLTRDVAHLAEATWLGAASLDLSVETLATDFERAVAAVRPDLDVASHRFT